MSQCIFNICFSIVIVLTTSFAFQSNDLNRGFSEFSKDFYWECAQSKPGNIIISPLSVANVLTLLSQGADETTFDELRSALHLSIDKDTVANQTFENRESLYRNVGDAILSIANRIYIQQGHQLKKSFQDVAVSKFQSDVSELNFAESVESAQTINRFVEEKTNGKIKDLVQPDNLSGDTRSVLINAIYFKGNWEVPFLEFGWLAQTHKREFFVNESENVTVDFMVNKHHFNYGHIAELRAQVLEMKYANSNLSFLVLLPDHVMGLPELETKLKNYNLEKIVAQMSSNDSVEVEIPKFKIEYEIELTDVLRKLGINKVFDNGLNGILDSDERLEVSAVLHKAFIEINEKGAEAAAATGGIIDIRCCTPSFIADHPFMFFIRDSDTNTVIFSGRIVNFD